MGSPPALAIFADNMWYKAEAYIGSEYAGRHLYDNQLVPIYVSDNPILNAQHVVFKRPRLTNTAFLIRRPCFGD